MIVEPCQRIPPISASICKSPVAGINDVGALARSGKEPGETTLTGSRTGNEDEKLLVFCESDIVQKGKKHQKLD